MNTRVLIIDNDQSVRQSLSRALRSEGCAVEEVASGQDAPGILARETTDLVLLDLNMPVVSGWEALDRIKETNPGLPVIVITANPNDHRLAANGREVAAVLEKPFGVPALLDLIKQIVAEPVEQRKLRLVSRKALSARGEAVS